MEYAGRARADVRSAASASVAQGGARLKPLDTVVVGLPIGNYSPVIAMSETATSRAKETYAGVHYDGGDIILTTWARKPMNLLEAVDHAREATAAAAKRDLYPIPEGRPA